MGKANYNNNAEIAKLLVEKGVIVDIPLGRLNSNIVFIKFLASKHVSLNSEQISKLREESSIPATVFADKNIELNAAESTISSKQISFTFTNKLQKFARVSAVSMYLNGKIVGTADMGIELPPSSTTIQTYKLPITTEMFNTLIAGKNQVVPIKYGFAVKYTVDNKS